MGTSDNFLDDHTFLGDGQRDTLDQRLARELPDGDQAPVPFERQLDAVGELVAAPTEDEDGQPAEQVLIAGEPGPVREGAPAEQRAMHVVDPAAEWSGMQEDYSPYQEDPNATDSLDEAHSAATPAEAHPADPEAPRRDDAADEFIFNPEYEDDRVPLDDV